MAILGKAICPGLIWILVTTSAAQSADCDLNGKTINYMVSICYDGGVQSGQCRFGTEKIKIIGKSVLHYWDMAKNIGIQFTLGESRDLLSGADEVQKQLLLPDQKLLYGKNIYASFGGIANFVNNALTISTTELYHTSIDGNRGSVFYKRGDVLGSSVTSTTFAIRSDCTSCNIVGYVFDVRDVSGNAIMKTRLVNSTCTID